MEIVGSDIVGNDAPGFHDLFADVWFPGLVGKVHLPAQEGGNAAKGFQVEVWFIRVFGFLFFEHGKHFLQ